jgi:hypothetical protein
VISDGFLDDIALPNVGLELEWERQKHNKSYIEEVEKYKKEILTEGLQVGSQVEGCPLLTGGSTSRYTFTS